LPTAVLVILEPIFEADLQPEQYATSRLYHELTPFPVKDVPRLPTLCDPSAEKTPDPVAPAEAGAVASERLFNSRGGAPCQ
jgi:hypothetical protein